MTSLRLRAASGESLIKIGADILKELPGALTGSTKVMIITDENIAALYKGLLNDIAQSNPDITFYPNILPAGESEKTLATHGKILNTLAEYGFTRSDCVLAMGGGVVSDIAGFCAATYMRGIRYSSVPTTLLAMVDAAMGGKCGVNLEKGKNLAGCFYQPEVILINPQFLATLDKREFNCGIAEIIKYAAIADSSIFALLDDAGANIDKLIYKSVLIKKEIVESDERESLTRMKLNFGHTLGHIAEKAGGYSLYSHGEAVAYGMRKETQLLKLAGLAEDNGIIETYLDKFGLNITPPLTKEIVVKDIFSDKKMRGDSLYFAGFSTPGKGMVYKFSKEQMLSLLDRLF
ncbi:MAG: 3-dehydroquinate synthase [Christensenellales bacterium]|jgi:3-dehydroquinate synthase